MRPLSGDIFLVEGNNQLDVQLVPVGVLPLAPGDYILTNPGISPSEAVVGELVEISVLATNRTGSGGSVTATCAVDGQQFSHTVYVPPLSAVTIIFEFVPLEARQYTVTIPLVGVDGQTVIVTRYLLVSLGVTYPRPELISLNVPSVPAGGTFTATATIFLPKPFQYDSGWYGGEWLPAGMIANPLYIVRFVDGTFIDPSWGEWQVEVINAKVTPDDFAAAPDGIFTISGRDGEPAFAPPTPGVYPITLSIVVWTAWWDGRGWGTTSPYIPVNLGKVGELRVT